MCVFAWKGAGGQFSIMAKICRETDSLQIFIAYFSFSIPVGRYQRLF